MEEKKNDKEVLLIIFVDDEQVSFVFKNTVADALDEVKRFKFIVNPSGYLSYKIYESACEGEA